MPAQNALEILEELRQSWEVAINTCQSEWTLTITQPTTAKALLARMLSADDGNTAAKNAESDVPTPPPSPLDHDYLSAGDNPHASGDRAYRGCSLCGRPRSEHRR